MNNMKNFLQRMIKYKGFIAQGVYSEDYKYWHSNTKDSASTIDMNMFNELKSNGYIKMDRTGKYYPTDKGRKFAMPWYRKIFDVI